MLRLLGLIMVCGVALLGLAARAGAADTAALINRLTLIPAAPGGPMSQPPCYALDALPPATFEVLLNNELAGAAPEEYYLDRARLLAASYSVLVFDAADYRPLYSGRPPRPLAVIGPDEGGSYRLDQAGLAPGGDYVWLVTAQVEDAAGQAVLWSVPLYFRLLPAAGRIPEVLPAADQQTLRGLYLLNAQQERSRENVRTALRGLALYYNFAAASDTFFCAPLDERAPSPWPDPAPGGWPFLALLQLGDAAAELLVLQRQQDHGQSDLGRARLLGVEIQRLAAGLAGAQGANSVQLSAFAEAGRRLASAEADGLPALLSELLIALDGVVGTGSRPLPAAGLASFPAYARASVRRLESLEEYSAQLQASMAPDDWSAWSDTLRQLRAELTLMADDVERGRLNMQQLDQQMQRAWQIAAPVYGEEWRFIDRVSGQALTERVDRIRPDEAEQRRRLSRELYWFQLNRFVKLILPPPGTTGA